MKDIFLALCFIPLAATADLTVETARFGSLKPSQYVVTNISGSVGITHSDATNIVDSLVTLTNGINRYNLQTRLTSANAGANIAIGGHAAHRFVLNYGSAENGYTESLPDYRENVGLYSDESLSDRIGEVNRYPLEMGGGYWFELNGGEMGICTLDQDYESTIIISAPSVATTNALNDAIATRQHLLPYPTNAIPYAAVSGGPTQYTDVMVTNVVRNDTQLWQDCASPVASPIADSAALYNLTEAYVYAASSNAVQYLTLGGGTNLVITPPASVSGKVMDWVVYANAEGGNAVTLANSVNWYATEESVTNALEAGVTAFYCTQMSTDRFAVGRQKLANIVTKE